MSYAIQMWCRDCFGIDPLGCFDGEREWLVGDDDKLVVFETREAAEAAGDERQNGAPYEFDVVEVDKPVTSPQPDCDSGEE